MRDGGKSFADWMRDGAALNVPAREPRESSRADSGSDAGSEFVWPPDCAGNAERFHNLREHRRPGVDNRRMKDIARAKRPPDDEIDLHGCALAEAHWRLGAFLRRAAGDGLRVVEIVHGRGLRADDGRGVLRGKTRQWLVQCEWILAFAELHRNSGAVRALLRKGSRR